MKEPEKMRGTEDQFNNLIKQISQSSRRLDEGSIKYIQWADLMDALFNGQYGWSREEFAKECKIRLGKQEPDKPKKEQSKKSPRRRSVKKAV